MFSDGAVIRHRLSHPVYTLEREELLPAGKVFPADSPEETVALVLAAGVTPDPADHIRSRPA